MVKSEKSADSANNETVKKSVPEDPEDIFLDKIRRPKEHRVALTVTPTHIGIGIPNDQVAFIVIDDDAFRFECLTFRFKLTKPDQLCVVVADSAAEKELAGKVMNTTLHVGLTRSGAIFILPQYGPHPITGMRNQWHQAMDDVIARAQKGPIFCKAVSAGVGYETSSPVDATTAVMPTLPPHMPMKKILYLAFGQRILESLDHPIMIALRSGQQQQG